MESNAFYFKVSWWEGNGHHCRCCRKEEHNTEEFPDLEEALQCVARLESYVKNKEDYSGITLEKCVVIEYDEKDYERYV